MFYYFSNYFSYILILFLFNSMHVWYLKNLYENNFLSRKVVCIYEKEDFYQMNVEISEVKEIESVNLDVKIM